MLSEELQSNGKRNPKKKPSLGIAPFAQRKHEIVPPSIYEEMELHKGKTSIYDLDPIEPLRTVETFNHSAYNQSNSGKENGGSGSHPGTLHGQTSHGGYTAQNDLDDGPDRHHSGTVHLNGTHGNSKKEPLLSSDQNSSTSRDALLFGDKATQRAADELFGDGEEGGVNTGEDDGRGLDHLVRGSSSSISVNHHSDLPSRPDSSILIRHDDSREDQLIDADDAVTHTIVSHINPQLSEYDKMQGNRVPLVPK